MGMWMFLYRKLVMNCSSLSQEISSFLEQPDVITHVSLVQPKRALFVDEISSLLVICTPVSVLLLGVSLVDQPGLDKRPGKGIKLYATDLTISTDIEMTSVIGTKDGRIFMCGQQDGNLYELHYQETESWFGKRVQLINHSVGGVQSLLPRFASTATDGKNFLKYSWVIHSHISPRTDRSGCFRSQKKLFLYPQLPKYNINVCDQRRQSYPTHSNPLFPIQNNSGKSAWISCVDTSKLPDHQYPYR